MGIKPPRVDWTRVDFRLLFYPSYIVFVGVAVAILIGSPRLFVLNFVPASLIFVVITTIRCPVCGNKMMRIGTGVSATYSLIVPRSCRHCGHGLWGKDSNL
jgi:hypothetical protein